MLLTWILKAIISSEMSILKVLKLDNNEFFGINESDDGQSLYCKIQIDYLSCESLEY